MKFKWVSAMARTMGAGSAVALALLSFSGGDAQQAPAAVRIAVADADIAQLRQGLSAAQMNDWNGLRTARAVAADPLVKKILAWRLASAANSDVLFEEIDNALKELPGWPGRQTMRRRGEQMIFDSSLGPADRAAWLTTDGGPLTGDGQIALADAYYHLSRVAEAQALARDAWRQRNLTPHAQEVAESEFGSTFSSDDYADRVENLLWRDQSGDASRLLSHLSASDRALANARIALQRGSSPTPTKVRSKAPRGRHGVKSKHRRTTHIVSASVPSEQEDDPGILYDRARNLRRAGKPDDALVIAAQIVPTLAPASAREAIFDERRLYVPRALRSGQITTALQLASNHGLTSGEDFADAEWLAGWIELRFLKNPANADMHFAKLAANVSTPVSRARAFYWRAEAVRALGRAPEADALLAQAAAYDFTYYGQLAAVKANPNATMNFAASPPLASDALVAFESRDLVKALRLISLAGDRESFDSLAFALDDQLSPPAAHEMLARIALQSSYTRTAVRTAKSGIRRGIFAQDAAFPVMNLPDDAKRADRPEPALILAITRQESEFDPQAMSPAGARGLMQLMPATAKLTASHEGMPFSPDMLLTDPNYNLTIGAAYLEDLIARWNGSYILAIASYNAGTGRTQEWVDASGDPRMSGVDAVDWVELIPFSETRNYVQRVIENLEVYRQRLAGRPVPIRISEDLKRGGAR